MFFLRDNFCTAGHTSEMMAGVTVVLLDGDGMCLADNVTFCRQYLCKRIPVVRVKDAIGQVLDFVIQTPEGCSITTACNPGHGSP